ncbi:MAG: glutamine-hydrolyzing carbamoyl-phosphate synthase small subunit [Deltaproteobacteria bacterium]|nr:glutamine-hydrolyzing carbamoyl-phosphate synthase small subunit [Deltaproteobacteria bacterium]
MKKKVAKTDKKALLILKDGTSFEGRSFGYEGDEHEDEDFFSSSGEVVFNTSMTGYQEILTDPSYKWQMVCMTYPEIGNYGINLEDVESAKPQVSGFIVKNYNASPSNFRSEKTLAAYLKENKIPGIEGIDTRALTQHLRDRGAQPGVIAVGDFDADQIKKNAKKLPGMDGMDLVKEVTCKSSYKWHGGLWRLNGNNSPQPSLTLREGVLGKKPYRITAYDFGIKQNILRCLVSSGFDVVVVPAQTPAKQVLAQKPDGVFLSNGPGDPAAVTYAIENVSRLLGKVPVFGICLGHQIMGLALGAKTFKLKFGHRGGNQPVMDLSTRKVEITSQNHGFAVEEKSLSKIAAITHINLNDKTVEGLANFKQKYFSVQYHPEASPGPHDSMYLFERFKQTIAGKY